MLELGFGLFFGFMVGVSILPASVLYAWYRERRDGAD